VILQVHGEPIQTVTGTAPTNFTNANQVFNIRNNATPTIGAAWTVSGSNSRVITGDGTNPVNFTVPSTFAFTGPVNVLANATLTLQNTTIPTLGSLAATSTVVYNGAACTNSATRDLRQLNY
jgi:glutamine cyclotransferase